MLEILSKHYSNPTYILEQLKECKCIEDYRFLLSEQLLQQLLAAGLPILKSANDRIQH